MRMTMHRHHHQYFVFFPIKKSPVSCGIFTNLAILTTRMDHCQFLSLLHIIIIIVFSWQYYIRLVGGLASEKVRWAESVQKFKEEEKTLAGDVLLTASYLSYVGCFGRSYRIDMLDEQWLKFLQTQEVRTLPKSNIFMACFIYTNCVS